MKIIRLESANVKRLKAVEIKPDGSLVVIGGRNSAGKSSVLSSIAYALGGKDEFDEMPVRKGEQKAKIVCDLGEIVVTRTITSEGGTTLIVQNKDGAKFPSPQAVLDKLLGKLTFDPLAFMRMDKAKKQETLRQVVGLDFGSLDEQRTAAYDERTMVGREVKTLEGQLAGLPQNDAPPEEVSIRKLTDDLQAAINLGNAAVTKQGELDLANRKVDSAHLNTITLADKIKAIESELADLKPRLERAQAEKVKFQTEAGAVEEQATAARAAVPDVNPIRQQIADAETTNRKVRENRKRTDVATSLTAKSEKYTELTASIDQIDQTKHDLIAGATFPVPGLSISADDVLFNGVPLDQAASSEQLRTSVALGFALNKSLKILLIENGSLLDEDGVRTIAEMAAENDAQVWMEMAGKSGQFSVLIEDGMVVSQAAPLDSAIDGLSKPANAQLFPK